MNIPVGCTDLSSPSATRGDARGNRLTAPEGFESLPSQTFIESGQLQRRCTKSSAPPSSSVLYRSYWGGVQTGSEPSETARCCGLNGWLRYCLVYGSLEGDRSPFEGNAPPKPWSVLALPRCAPTYNGPSLDVDEVPPVFWNSDRGGSETPQVEQVGTNLVFHDPQPGHFL